jgi:hypothetical protein
VPARVNLTGRQPASSVRRAAYYPVWPSSSTPQVLRRRRREHPLRSRVWLEITSPTIDFAVTFAGCTRLQAAAWEGPPRALIEAWKAPAHTLSVRLEVCWDGVNWTDETDHLSLDLAISGSASLDQQTRQLAAGELSLGLDNHDLRYSLANPASPLRPYLTHGGQKVRLWLGWGGHEELQGTYYIDTLTEDPENRTVELRCLDRAAALNQVRVTYISSSESTDTTFRGLCDAAGLVEGRDYWVESGEGTVQYPASIDAPLWSELQHLAVAEGGRCVIDPWGIIRFVSRSHHQELLTQETVSLAASQHTYRVTGRRTQQQAITRLHMEYENRESAIQDETVFVFDDAAGILVPPASIKKEMAWGQVIIDQDPVTGQERATTTQYARYYAAFGGVTVTAHLQDRTRWEDRIPVLATEVTNCTAKLAEDLTFYVDVTTELDRNLGYRYVTQMYTWPAGTTLNVDAKVDQQAPERGGSWMADRMPTTTGELDEWELLHQYYVTEGIDMYNCPQKEPCVHVAASIVSGSNMVRIRATCGVAAAVRITHLEIKGRPLRRPAIWTVTVDDRAAQDLARSAGHPDGLIEENLRNPYLPAVDEATERAKEMLRFRAARQQVVDLPDVDAAPFLGPYAVLRLTDDVTVPGSPAVIDQMVLESQWTISAQGTSANLVCGAAAVNKSLPTQTGTVPATATPAPILEGVGAPPYRWGPDSANAARWSRGARWS